MKILSLLDEIIHVYQIISASGSAPSLRQWFRTLLEAPIFSMYANTIINIHVGTDGDINVDTDALVERVSTTSAPIATVLIATSTDKWTITLLILQLRPSSSERVSTTSTPRHHTLPPHCFEKPQGVL